eukprot:jgi/Astpho2/3117/e_gw1.00051.34.1_t
MAELERLLLQEVNSAGRVADSAEFAIKHQLNHDAVVGQIKSLLAADMVEAQEHKCSKLSLTEEGAQYAENGMPEAQILHRVAQAGAAGIPQDELQQSLGPIAKIGLGQALKRKLLSLDKGSGKPVLKMQDEGKAALLHIQQGQEVPKATADDLRKRKLVAVSTWTSYSIAKGPKFALQRRKQHTDLTFEMLQSGSWQDADFKPYNFQALGLNLQGGHLHPLMKVRTQFRKIFVAMGFEEMPTNNYVESCFWNFDALFQPQQHPARDAHDTFFLTNPARTPAERFPQDYLQRVRAVHEQGGYGSTGYRYSWKVAEAEKNVLRTHTTAVSSRMLYKLAQEGFRPAKYFSIDRVFRNEAVDRTHLAEFHQIEGLVCDKGLTLANLIGTLHQFFQRLGLKKLRFKPAYNPYTEPSMEIFSYSEELGKWIEVGNSGMFRPEMLQPMGLPEDVNVIAWGLSLERPTMILYGIDNIRDLFGHKVSLQLIKKNPICRLGL